MGRGVSAETRRIVERARELWEATYSPAHITPTVRQLFYALAVEEFVPKSEAGYDRVQRTLARARERGDYPWEGIHDGLRQVAAPSTWEDLADFCDTVRGAYRRDKWQSQPRRVEVWIEKDAVRGTVAAVTTEYEVPLLCGRGYLSVTAKMEAGRRIAGQTVLYVGDFDPSGVNMLEETGAWIRAASGDGATMERVAITEQDHANPDMARLPVNLNDARATDFVRRFGQTVVEVEALPPLELQARLRDAIERHRDITTWEAELRREKGERRDLARRLGG